MIAVPQQSERCFRSVLIGAALALLITGAVFSSQGQLRLLPSPKRQPQPLQTVSGHDTTDNSSIVSKVLLAAVAPAVTALLALLIGNRIAARWGVRQKRREMAMATANEFYKLYGEFFGVWKLWNYALDTRDDQFAQTNATLLARAAAAEGGMEAILVKLAAERTLTLDEQSHLGRFRQAYQCLRQTIKKGKPLDWPSSEHAQYLAFKGLACHVAAIVTAEPTEPPSGAVAAESLRKITSNFWETRWVNGA